jgi:hypothetical protein
MLTSLLVAPPFASALALGTSEYASSSSTSNFRMRSRTVRSAPVVSALCYPMQTRPRGCEPLTSGSFSNQNSLEKRPLPCVESGTCPYLSFRCRRGHEWKAVPGSPVCFHCPVCDPNQGGTLPIRGYTTGCGPDSNLTADSWREEVLRLTQTRSLVLGGECLSTEVISWKSKLSFRCGQGHEWEAVPGNILYGGSWCPGCSKQKRTLSHKELQATASYFGGEYIGQAAADAGRVVSQRRHEWVCSEGHRFIQSPNNVRRKAGSKRKCSWCRSCSAAGKTFAWRPPS